MSDALRLYGTRVIVMSAADGIGEAIVRTFIKQGAAVFAVDRPDSGVDRQFRSLRGVTSHMCNVTNQVSADEMVAAAGDALDGLDVVVNNGAVQAKSPIADANITQLEQLLDQKIKWYEVLSSR